MTRSPWPGATVPVAALLCGIAIAIVDRAQSEVQPAVLLLFASAAAFAWFRPQDAWLHALLLGAGIPGLELVTRLAGAPPAPDAVPGSSVLAFVPAAIGAGAGSLLRRMLRGSAP